MRNRPSDRRLRRGFSLVEVIVAVTIIALLAALVAPRLYRFIGTAKDSKAKAETSSIAQQVKLYMTENGLSTVPGEFELEWLCEGENPYLESTDDLKDPWGNTYVIVIPGSGRDFDIVSYGLDGQPGGEGENKDIVHGR
jgi:general secretion pathway protein G